MVNGKILKFFIIFLAIISFVFGQKAFAYDDTIAHPNIAKMAAETYNKQYNAGLSDEDIKLIMQGAHEEDTPIRWMNHFYDPVYNEGLFFWDKQYQTSKIWAINSEDQTTYGKGDRSWYRAIADYKAGNKEEALKELGHIVHLVSDLGVPAHTRNDPHADEWSYEDYVKENWSSIMVSLDKNFSVKELNNLDQAFDELANYSNNNFYSVDTFESPKYKIIEVTGYGRLGPHLIAKNNDIFLYIVDENFLSGKSTKEFNKEIIHKNNAQYLIPKSIEYSAGVIKLFFDEVNKEQNVSLSTNRSKLFTANKLIGGLVGGALAMDDSTFNIFSKAINTGKVANTAFADNYTQIKNGYNEIVKTAQNNLSQITFDQILATMSNFRVANAPQTKNTVPEISPTPISIPVQTPEQIQNIPEPIQTAPTLPIQQSPSKKVEDNSTFHFVFGPGGEQNPPEPAPTLAPIAQMEITQTTSTEEKIETPTTTENIIETPTTTPGIVEETTTSTEPIVEESPTSTEDIIETPTTTPEIVEETTTSTEPIIEEEIVEEEDATPPDMPSLNLAQNISTSTTSTVQLSWNSTTEDVSYYDIEYQNNGEWETLLFQTTSTEYKMEAEKFRKYAFRANATDMSGNASDWAEKTVTIDWPKSVVINEIAWMGVAANKSSDEWLELYNNTDQDIDLTGWKITVSGKEINWNNTSSTIKVNNYYLLERTNNNTVADILADGIFTITGGLKNTGADLQLLNNNGEIIDQVDNSSGWFAGETGTKYKTMERISRNNPGTQANNWQTSDTYSFKGKGDGGARIYGTPRQPNQGYWYLQNLTTEYASFFDKENTFTLTAENSPYFIDSQTEIPAGFTLKLKEGVVIAGASDSSYLKVKGNLIIEGTPEKPVIFTSARDKNYINFNLTDLAGSNPEPGDWSRIEVSENGKINANDVKFLYGGQKYFLSGGFMFGGEFPSRIINNLGGEVNLDYAYFQNNFIRSDNENKTYDALVWLEPANGLNTTTTINNSVFDGGYRAIKNQKQNNYLSISNSSFKNFTNKNGPITSIYDLPIMKNNVFANNARDIVEIQEFTVNKDTALDSQVEYLMNYIIINTGATLQISPGTIINLLNQANIAVNGNLEAIGASSNKIIIRSDNAAEKWGNMIFNNSTSTLEYVNIAGGNNGSINTPQNNGMLWMKNSNVTLNNVSLADARRPYNMVYSKDSKLKMTDSEISWSKPKESNGWTIDGIHLDGGYLYLNNTTFNQMDRGIELYNLSTIEIANMTLGHFTNISDLNWWPINAIEF